MGQNRSKSSESSAIEAARIVESVQAHRQRLGLRDTLVQIPFVDQPWAMEHVFFQFSQSETSGETPISAHVYPRVSRDFQPIEA